MKILLVKPDPSKINFFAKRKVPYLALQVIAGLTPSKHIVETIDEPYDDDGDGVYDYDPSISAESATALDCDLFIAKESVKSITGEVPEFIRSPWFIIDGNVRNIYSRNNLHWVVSFCEISWLGR